MSLKEQLIEKLREKVSSHGAEKYKFSQIQFLTIRDLRQILKTFEEYEERIRELEKATRALCEGCDEYPCFTYFEKE